MLRWSVGLSDAAKTIERAVSDTIAAGVRTSDIVAPGKIAATTAEFGDEVAGASRPPDDRELNPRKESPLGFQIRVWLACIEGNDLDFADRELAKNDVPPRDRSARALPREALSRVVRDRAWGRKG